MTTESKKKAPHPLVYAAIVIVAISFLFYSVFGTPSLFQIQANAGLPTVTFTATETTASYLTTTSASVNTATQTITSLITVTQRLPSNVDIGGTAKSNGIGTTATDVIFTDTNSSAVFHSSVTNGQYLIHGLPNDKTYLVQIGYSGTPVGGKCDVKIWTVALTGTSTTANLSC